MISGLKDLNICDFSLCFGTAGFALQRNTNGHLAGVLKSHCYFMSFQGICIEPQRETLSIPVPAFFHFSPSQSLSSSCRNWISNKNSCRDWSLHCQAPASRTDFVYLWFNSGSLEVKLPTMWTDGKAEVGRVRETEKEEDQRRERARRKEMQVREKVEKLRITVFFQKVFCGSGRSN